VSDIIFYKQFMTHGVIFLQFVIETMSVLCIVIGLLWASYILIFCYRNPYGSIRIRLGLGGWLAVALEFQLASDILATTISPTIDELIKLAIITVIRTVLNFFLSKELEAQSKTEKVAEDKTS
jgi:Predicted membrane protein